jgi:plastocyanin
MQLSGEYKVIVTYQPPSLVIPESELVELYFNYSNRTETGATGGEGVGTGVSITAASSTKTTDAFQPNLVQVSVGSTVTWTNDDAQPHIVSSGENATPSGLFESPLMAPAATFEHTFTEAGEYPYFCLLHPNMVGTVQVN